MATGNTQQIIDYGASANDGTGDPLRTAFIKTDENFDNIWLAGPVGSNISIVNNTIGAINTNGNIILSPNGIGVIQTNNRLVPRVDRTYDIGASDLRYRNVYANMFMGNATLGNASSITLDVNDLHILGGTNGYVLQTDGAGNLTWTAQTGGGGNGVPGGANTQVQYNNAGNFGGTAGFTFNNISGNLAIPGKILTIASLAGNANAASNAGISINGANANIIYTSIDQSWGFNKHVKITPDSGSNTWYFGNSASNNTLVFPSGAMWQSDAANLEEYLSSARNGYINMQTFDSAGNVAAQLHIEQNLIHLNVFNGAERQWEFNADGTTHVPGSIIPDTSNVYSLGNATNQWSDLYVSNATIYMNNVPISLTSGNVLTVAGADVVTTNSSGEAAIGNLDIAGATVSIAAGAADTYINISPTIEGSAYLQLPTDATANVYNTRLHNDRGNVEIGSDGGTWLFDSNGGLKFPGNTIAEDDIEGTGNFGFETPANVGFGILTNAGSQEWAFGVDGTLTFPSSVNGQIFAGVDNDFIINTANTNAASYYFTFSQLGDLTVPVNLNVVGEIYTSNIVGDGNANLTVTANTQSWLFDDTGKLTAPGEVYGQYYTIRGGNGPGTDIGSLGYAGNIVDVYGIEGVRISTIDEGGPFWQFDTTGNLAIPGTIVSDSTILFDNRPSGNTADIQLYSADDILLQARDRTIGDDIEGGDINIYAGDGSPDDAGSGTGSGGDIQIIGGVGGVANALSGGSGGSVRLDAGNGGDGSATAAAGSGATAYLSAGDGGVDNGGGGNNGGDVVITAGDTTDVAQDRGRVILNAGAGGNATTTGGYVQVHIPSVGANPGGDWTFTGSGTTLETPANAEIFGPNFGNLTVGSAGNTIITSADYGYTTYNWVFDNAGGIVAPNLTVTRGDRTGTLTGSTLRIGNGSQEAILTTPNGVDGSDSQRLVINPGAGSEFGEGGDIYLYSGRGGASGGSGGDIKIRGGLGPADGDGGYLDIMGGEAAGNGAGGRIDILGGQSANSTGGPVQIYGGQGLVGGDANITGGVSTAGPGGDVNITGGTSSNGLAEYGNVTITAGASTWTFNNTGQIILPGEGVIRSIDDTIMLQSWNTSNSTNYGLRVGTSGGLYLEIGNADPWLSFTNDSGDAEIGAAPGVAGTGNAGYNLTLFGGPADTSVYGTGAGGNINLQAGLGASNDGGGGGPGGWVNIIAGNSYDPAGVSGNVAITSGSSTWTFDYNNRLSSGNLNITSQYGLGVTGTILEQDGTLELIGNGTGCVIVGWNSSYGTAGNVAQMYFSPAGNSGNIVVTTGNTAGTSYEWTFDNTGVLTAPGNISAGNFVGGGSNVDVVAGAYDWTFDNTGNLTLPGNTFSVNYANGTAVSLGGGSSYGNANVATFLAAYGSNTVVTTGNITGGNIIATANVLSNGYARLTGTFDESQASTAGLYLGYAGGTPRIMLGTGNTSQTLEIDNDGGTLRFYKPGTTLASLTSGGVFSVAGNVTGANLITAGQVTATGNITTSGNFIGNGAALTNVTVSVAGNIIGTQSNVTLVAGSYSYTFDNAGTLTLPAGPTGDEGGEIAFTQAANSTLAGNTVVFDQYVDRIRFFEGGGNARGAYIDMTQTADGVGTLLNNRVSGLVNAGTFVTMDLLKATVTSSGNRGLSLAATTGSFNINISGTYGSSGGSSGTSGTATITTTPSGSQFNWNFVSQGDGSTYIITDTTNSRAYRITLQIGGSFLNNMISIERLV